MAPLNLPPCNTTHETERVLSPATRTLLGCASTHSTRQSYVAQLEKRVLDMEYEIKVIKEHQNAISLPNTLPPELLSDIFLLYSNAIQRAYWPGDKRIGSWIRFTHVCRHWRAVAFNSPAVWSSPLFDIDPAFTKMMLARSRPAALRIKYAWGGTIYNDFLLEAMSFPRIAVLDVNCSQNRSLDISPALADITATRSQHLKEIALCSYISNPIKLPSDFTLPAASLTHLSLIRVGFQWDNLPLGPTLQVLRIKQLQRHAAPPCPWGKVWRALQRLPLLRVLDLSSTLPDEPLPSEFRTRFLFSSLEFLGLEESLLSMSELLSVLRIPATCRTSLSARDLEPATETLGQCIANLKAAWEDDSRKDSVTGIREVQVADGFDYRFFDIVYLLSGSDGHKKSEFDLRLQLTPHALSISMAALKQALVQHLGLARLALLDFIDSGFLIRDHLIDLFGDLPNIKTIRCRLTQAFTDLIGILDSDPATIDFPNGAVTDLDEESQALPYFPRLKTIEVQRPDYYDFGIDFDIARLASVLNRRPNRYRIKRLDLKDPREFPDNYEYRLCEALPGVEVVWNDKVVRLSDEDRGGRGEGD